MPTATIIRGSEQPSIWLLRDHLTPLLGPQHTGGVFAWAIARVHPGTGRRRMCIGGRMRRSSCPTGTYEYGHFPAGASGFFSTIEPSNSIRGSVTFTSSSSS